MGVSRVGFGELPGPIPFMGVCLILFLNPNAKVQDTDGQDNQDAVERSVKR